jgi:parallel beta-helix repeat protein
MYSGKRGIVMRNSLIFLSLILFTTTALASQRVVPIQYETIQDAINACSNGDIVIVLPGHYKENIDFLGKAITVKSYEGPEVTIIDADFDGSAVKCDSGEDTTSVLDGFTLTNGTGTYLYPAYYGGALFIRQFSNPKIINNIITGNSCYRGAGLWVYSSSPIVSGNIFTGNSSTFGGGIALYNTSSTIENNIITMNTSYQGGGIHLDNSSGEMINNIIAGNYASDSGAGIYCRLSTDTQIFNNLIFNNHADESGGGFYCWNSSSPIVKNSTFTGNSASESGGGFFCTGSGASPTVINTIFWENEAPLGSEVYVGLLSSFNINYSDIEGGQDEIPVEGTLDWGPGNIDIDPLFSDGIYHLRNNSPCVDAGVPSIFDTCRPPGKDTKTSDIGAYGGVNNCWWPELGLDFIFFPTGPTSVPAGDILYFNTVILNNTTNTISGDLWFVIRLPNSHEILVPGQNLNYPNPTSGQIVPFDLITLPIEMNIPVTAPAGEFTLLGRIGIFPDTISDERSFTFDTYD